MFLFIIIRDVPISRQLVDKANYPASIIVGE